MRGLRMWLLPGALLCITFGSGCAHSAQTPSDNTQKMAEMSRQADINFKSDQINRSNLPAEQKQQLLDQLRNGATK